MEVGHHVATEATTALRALGLDEVVRVVHGDGYLGCPDGAPYDRLIATCGIAGISPQWLDQLVPATLIIAPVAHAGIHPILAAHRHPGTGMLAGRALLWSNFIPMSTLASSWCPRRLWTWRVRHPTFASPLGRSRE
jgi:protein-L-isoaspartate(D-aspartate) O-methyltransferase